MNLFLAKRRKVQSYGYGGMSDLLRVWQSEDRTPAFIQWRTTCQVENSSSSSASRQVHMGPQLRVMKSYAKKYSHSLPYALYGDRFNQQQQQQNPIGLRLQAIVFGTPKDGFYMRTGYVSWQAILSMDEPTRGDYYRFASLLGGTIAFAIMIFVLPLAIYATLRYKRRLERPPQEDMQPILDNNDNTEHRNPSESSFGIGLRCGGRLRLCRRIPSPDPEGENETGDS
uniref:Lysosomal transcription factor, NCU-G1 n=1 Tax=Schistocephalus solidus TaxID=70667 RepID=A0A0X3PU83_SCHSO